jgi:hypothetical protein
VKGGLKVKNKLILALFIGATLALLWTNAAMATDGATLPHGGYDATTNSCLFCHDVHDAAGDYALMRQETVTETCGTCHDLYKTDNTASVWDNPAGYPGTQPVLPIAASASWRSVYEIDSAGALNAGGHRLGLGDAETMFADSVNGQTNVGDYIPGGSDTLTEIADIAGYGYDPTDENSFGGVLDNGRQATNGLYCASCHTPHGDFGQLLKDGDGNVATVDSDGRGKLLSARPNHSAVEATLPTNDWQNEGGPEWCTKCHDQRLDEANGGDLHNHPSEYCLTCHGNYNGATDVAGYPASADVTDDFPHTSPQQNILQAVPDELCLRCHVEGELP